VTCADAAQVKSSADTGCTWKRTPQIRHISSPYTTTKLARTVTFLMFGMLLVRIFAGTMSILSETYGKVKVKCTLLQALKLSTGRSTHRGRRGIALPFHDHGTGRDEGSDSRPGRSLPLGKNWYPMYRRLGGH